MSRDLALYFSNKLASEWSASSVTGLLSAAAIQDISTTQKWEALDPLVRVRLLLTPMFLRRQELADLRPALTSLKSVVAQDTDEWVRVIAAAVGSYDGILHMDAVLEHSKLVKATLEELKRHGAGADPTIFRPLEEKYLSTAVLEKRLPGSTVKSKHIPGHSHFILRDAATAPGNTVGAPSAAGATAPAGALNRPPSTTAGGIGTSGSSALPSRPSSAGLLPGKPPMGPSRLTAPGVGGGGSGTAGKSSLFMANRKPLGGGSLASRASGSAALGGGTKTAAGFKQKKKLEMIDITAVAKLNQAAALERERKQKEEAEAREAAALAKAEAKRLEKEAKEEKKKRDAARAAAAKDAEKEAEKAKKEAEALAAKEAAKAAKEAAKEEAARKKAEELAEKEAQRAQREAEKAEKERAKAARAELKRAAGESSGGGLERPAKASKKNAGATLPSALAAAQHLMDSAAVLQPGTNGEAPVVQLVDPQVALAALREAEAMSNGGYGDYTLLQQQQHHFGGSGDGGGESDDDFERYIELGRAAAAEAEIQRKKQQDEQKDVLGDTGVITDPHELEVFNRDWMGKYEGHSKVVLKPRTTEHVSQLLSHCHSRRLAVCPQGGNTGLVGGSVPLFDEIIINMSSMNKIIDFDPVSGVLTCEAGCILESLDSHLAPLGYTVPIDLGAKGSCHIGGNVATNAGGLRLLRYGSLHGSVLGLEAVLADGAVLDTLSVLRKDNTGYDVKQLFIGSEGTLGIVTQVALLCPPRPQAVNVAYLACPSFAAATAALGVAKQKLGEILSAFEFLDRESLEITLKYLPGARDPLPGSNAPFFLVVETLGSDAVHDASKMESFLDAAMTAGVIEDGAIAQDSAQAASMWKLREGITEALRHRGAIYKYDVSLPVPLMYNLVEDMRKRLDTTFPGGEISKDTNNTEIKKENDDDCQKIKVVGYGHLGDGNLHLNISVPHYNEHVRQEIEPWVYEWTSKVRGSVSAEHGLGAMKASAIGYSKSETAVDTMRLIKNALDPQGIMNPYKVLPPLI